MRNRAIDTNILIEIWHGRWPDGKPVRSDESATVEPRKWLRKYPHDGILSPTRLEFLGGTRSKDDLKLADIFLSEFPLFDDGAVLTEDWEEAERLARRVPRSGRSRGAIDCLLVAICRRLNLDLHSNDTGIS
jgi:predicted nucleic acid-binding protein